MIYPDGPGKEDHKPTPPLVSIGVPVRNAESLIAEALALLVEQTYKNVEIIISDNCSDDGTGDICRKYQSIDPRIRYFRQEVTLDAVENFRFVLERSRGDFFLWAAADDRRSKNYVETLIRALQQHSEASLAFPDVARFHDHANWSRTKPTQYEFELTSGNSYWGRIWRREFIRSGYLHIYGLIRRRAIAGYDWPKIEIGPDRPLLFHLSCRGDFIKAEGAIFYCYKPIERKMAAQRAVQYYGGALRSFRYTRLNWACARTGRLAESFEGRRRSQLATFALFQLVELKRKLRRILALVKNQVCKACRPRGTRFS